MRGRARGFSVQALRVPFCHSEAIRDDEPVVHNQKLKESHKAHAKVIEVVGPVTSGSIKLSTMHPVASNSTRKKA